MTQTDYEAALAYLFSATDYEKMRRVRYNADTFSLDRMHRLLRMLGSPHRRLRTVHLAGTKGKGSTAALIHAVATACGLTAGLYTSPHLVDIRERIRIGREDIPPRHLAALIEAARPHVDRMRAEDDAPTFFEIFTALAFGHFAGAAVEVAVVEVGLGGRLDATNVLVPDVSVITAVSLDHTLQLGDSLAAIAAEKAGIVKTGVPVVSQPQPPDAMAVIEDACRAADAPLLVVGRDVTYTWSPAEEGGRPGCQVTVRTPTATYASLFVPLMGEHQAINAAAAVAAAERCPPVAGRLTPEVVRDGFRQVHWPGRMEHRPGEPEMVLDGAHNRASIERLVEALGRHFPDRRVVVVFGSAADKDVDGMLGALADRMPDAPVVFTQTGNPRAADPADLARRFRACGGTNGEAAGDVANALGAAAAKATHDGLVAVCGSLYLVGEVMEHLAGADG